MCSDYFATSGQVNKKTYFSYYSELGSGRGCRWKYERSCASAYESAVEVLPQCALVSCGEEEDLFNYLSQTHLHKRMHTHTHAQYLWLHIDTRWGEKKKGMISVNGDGGGGLLLHLKRK